MSDNTNETIAVVGGGITGLFCAYLLANNDKKVYLFEGSERYGGRILTTRLYSNGSGDQILTSGKDLEFYAEFGPMRVELDKQLLLSALLNHLGIGSEPATEGASDEAYLEDFPNYASPVSTHDPQYNLLPDEVGKTPLQLLRLALLRIIVHLDASKMTKGFAALRSSLVNDITLASATQMPVEPLFAAWMKKLEEKHYWDIQTQGTLGGVPLFAMGFWNLLSDYLSHDAITKLRDLGTFFHLLPDNPNGAEWLVACLRDFASNDQLKGVVGGMDQVVSKLLLKINMMNPAEKPVLSRNCLVNKLERTENQLKLKLKFDGSPEFEAGASGDLEYDRVMLALPRRALEKIAGQSDSAFDGEPLIRDLLDSTFGIPLVKVFAVLRRRWWEDENRANRYATRVPTRELHYWKGRTKDSKKGMIMVYSDRPASSFWANYVPSGDQTVADETDGKSMLPPSLQERLKKKIVQCINQEDNIPNITPEDILWCGIRDWGRAPYSGAVHAWRPERKHWVVMRRLADIPGCQQVPTGPHIHVCGEAYSDYHGFIEGSLRSAVYALHCILDPKYTARSGSPKGGLSWLEAKEPVLQVDSKYLQKLRQWAQELDCTPNEDGFWHQWD